MNRLTSFDTRPSATTASVACWASSVPFVSRLWRELLKEMLSSYRPELHYMRGPGPRYWEKYGAPSVQPVLTAQAVRTELE